MIEKDFVTEGLKRTRIDEFLEKELERAGYGGMEIQVTPLGTMVVVYAERPGMVIGRGGKTVRSITQNLKSNYGLENPQVEVKEVDVPELNPKIMAHKIAAMLQRGMHFRRVAYTALRRIMGAGAQGVEVTISGKIRGSRSACAKFLDGYIKKCGEPSTRFVREGFATVQLKPGVLGIYVRIMPPGIVLPDKVDILKVEVEETPVDTLVENIEEESTESVEDVEVIEEITETADIAEIVDETEEDLEEIEEKDIAESDAEEVSKEASTEIETTVEAETPVESTGSEEKVETSPDESEKARKNVEALKSEEESEDKSSDESTKEIKAETQAESQDESKESNDKTPEDELPEDSEKSE
ncbi:MAG: 30S ribosomal protein S3 [Methanobacterium sp. PtaU1.Bin242]|nr:MAG: 30S ribosomal protein S3 [Methanobacterium sp. PtaU1.Bin242]